MTNNYVNKLSFISSPIVQNKVLNIGCYLLTNLKEENFLHEIKWISEVYPFLLCNKRRKNLCRKNKQY